MSPRKKQAPPPVPLVPPRVHLYRGGSRTMTWCGMAAGFHWQLRATSNARSANCPRCLERARAKS